MLSLGFGGVTRWMLGYTKLDWISGSREEPERISSIIKSRSSDDRQIERPWVIFKTNKLLKDEVPLLLLLLDANHFKFPKPYLIQTIIQSATISRDQRLLRSGQSVQRLSRPGNWMKRSSAAQWPVTNNWIAHLTASGRSWWTNRSHIKGSISEMGDPVFKRERDKNKSSILWGK